MPKLTTTVIHCVHLTSTSFPCIACAKRSIHTIIKINKNITEYPIKVYAQPLGDIKYTKKSATGKITNPKIVNGIKLRKSRITHSVVWDFFMEKY